MKTETLRRWIASGCAALLLALTVGVHAEEPSGAENGNTSLVGLAVDTEYVLGLARFDLDPHTEILGWQVSDRWYFGRQDGEDSGLTLVWQAEANQVSLSKDGVRLTRRF